MLYTYCWITPKESLMQFLMFISLRSTIRITGITNINNISIVRLTQYHQVLSTYNWSTIKIPLIGPGQVPSALITSFPRAKDPPSTLSVGEIRWWNSFWCYIPHVRWVFLQQRYIWTTKKATKATKPCNKHILWS